MAVGMGTSEPTSKHATRREQRRTKRGKEERSGATEPEGSEKGEGE